LSDHVYPDEFKDTAVPAPYLEAIGKVCIHWALLESIVDVALSKLAGFALEDSRGAIVTAHMSWPQKMDVLSAIVDAFLADHPHLARFESVKPLLKKAQEGRNRVVHGQWGVLDGKVHKLRLTARGKLKTSIEPIALDEIHAVALDIGRAGAATLKLVLNK
jgi:hypothetical protein